MTQQLRSRVRELRHVPARLIVGMETNWREHPKAQRQAVTKSLAEVGIYEPLIVRELPDGRYSIPDGHLRSELISADYGPETLIPIAVTDLDEAEALRVNATHDPMAAMARTNKERLTATLERLKPQGLTAVLERMPTIARHMPKPETPRVRIPVKKHVLSIVLDTPRYEVWEGWKRELGYSTDQRAMEAVLSDQKGFELMLAGKAAAAC